MKRVFTLKKNPRIRFSKNLFLVKIRDIALLGLCALNLACPEPPSVEINLSTIGQDPNADFTINADQIVTIDTNFVARYVTVRGILRCSQGAPSYTLRVAGIMVDGNVAQFECGTGTNPYQGRLNVELTGGLNDGQMHRRGIMMMNGAALNLHATTNGLANRTRLNQNANPGTTTIVTDQPMNGWRVGDEIIVAATGHRITINGNQSENERRSITAINGNAIALNAPLDHYHHGETEGYSEGTRSWTLDERAHIINLERNITISSINDSYWINDGFGAHVMVMNGSRGYVQGVKFERSGQLAEMGRYPFHWHELGNINGQYVRDSVVVESKNRCYTIHASNNATLDNNACYDHLGHGYFLEDGNETGNIISNNIAIWSRKPPVGKELLFSDIDPGNGPNSIGRQRAVGPSAYWITHPTNTVVNNVSIASEGSGFWMSFPDYVSCDNNSGCNGLVFPINAPTTAFNGNQAGTNIIGFTWDGKIDRNRQITTNPNNTTHDFAITAMHYNNDPNINGLVAYKSEETAVYYRGSGTMMRNVILADSVWQFFVANNQGLTDSLVVARSGNNSWGDSDNRLNTRVTSGVLFYDGPFDLVNTHFANFSSTRVYSPFNGQDITPEVTTIIGGSSKFTNIARGVTFSPQPLKKVNMDYSGRIRNWGDSLVTTMRDVGKSFDNYGPGDNRTLFKPANPINYIAGDCVYPANTVNTIRCDHGAATIKLGYADGRIQDNIPFNYRVIRQINYTGHVEHRSLGNPEVTYHQTKFPIITRRPDLNYVVDVYHSTDRGFSLTWDAENRTDVSPIIQFRNSFDACAVNSMNVYNMRQVFSFPELEAASDNVYLRMNEGIAVRMRATFQMPFKGNSGTAGQDASQHQARFVCP